MKCFFLLLAFSVCLSISIVQGQAGNTNNTPSCGSKEIMNHFLRENPVYRDINVQVEQKLLSYRQNSQRPSGTQATIFLPVVVHIIHNNGSENISDAQVMTGIQHLNEAFANTGYYDPANGVATNIQFCMAQRDPAGNATNGITRNVSAYTVMGGPSTYSDDLHVKDINRWNPFSYINIWIVKDIPGDVAGYAYLPAAHGLNVDGIVLEAAYFGSSNANDVVITHEMGHYLGLYHTFEGGCINNDCATDGDKVCDTPPDQSIAAVSCGVQVNSCSTDTHSGFSTDQNDLIADYMDYGNLDCMKVFTQGQADRMTWFVNNVRTSLLSARSCLPPCPAPVTAGFNSSANIVSAGSMVNFTNTSVNALTYAWYINNVLQAATTNFSYNFSVPGQFIIKLVSVGNNNALCDTAFEYDTIQVTCPVSSNFNASALEIPIGQTIAFTNTSSGPVTSYEWYVNDMPAGNTTDLSYQFNQPGTFTIRLNAAAALCNDNKSVTVTVSTPCSSDSYFEKVISDPFMQIFAYSNLVSQDNHIISAGKIQHLSGSSTPYPSWASIFKITNNGNLLWAKEYKGQVNTAFSKIIQAADGNFIAAGSVYVGGLEVRMLVIKIDPDGNIIWQKTFQAGVINYLTSAVSLIETPAHDLVMFEGLTPQSGPSRNYLLKLDASGNLLWSKELSAAGFSCKVTAMAIKNNYLYATLNELDSSTFTNYGGLIKSDLDGNLVYAKKYSSSETPTQRIDLSYLAFTGDDLSAYGKMSPRGNGVDTGSHLLIKMDTAGNIKILNRVRLSDISLYNAFPLHGRFGTVLQNGGFAFCESIYTTINNSRMFYHQNDLFNSSPSTVQLPSANRAAQGIMEGKNNNIIVLSTTIASGYYKDLSIYSTPKNGIISTSCGASASTYVNHSNSIVMSDLPGFSLPTATLIAGVPLNLYDSVITFSSNAACSATGTCYTVKIDMPDTICIAGDSVVISCRRNPGCTDQINWTLPLTAQNSFRQINDTTIKVLFPAYGQYPVTAALSSCSFVSDTIQLFVAKNASALSLGADKTLCSFSTSLLNAGTGYKSYNWQDGSQDSINTVYRPGIYYVTIKDFCNNMNADTVNYSVVALPAFDIGHDTTICSIDTLTITAPAGFDGYSWAPAYKISSTTGQIVKVWPGRDSTYTVTAVLNNSCIVIDSIRISVDDMLCQTVPLQLLRFNCRPVEAGIQVNWNTTNEINLSHFILEKSKGGIVFEPIARVTAGRLANNSYDFTDLQPFSGNNFYRLKQFDNDNSFVYSDVIHIAYSHGYISINPNPVNDILHIHNGYTLSSNTTIKVVDILGKNRLYKMIPGGISDISLAVSFLESGVYILFVRTDDRVDAIKFIKN